MPGKIWQTEAQQVKLWKPPARPWWKNGFWGFCGPFVATFVLGVLLAFLKGLLDRYGWGRLIEIFTCALFAIGSVEYFKRLRERGDVRYFPNFYWGTFMGMLLGYALGYMTGIVLLIRPV